MAAFPLLGTVGLAAASAVALAVCARDGHAVGVQFGLIALAVATFLALAMATKVALGREALIYYHHEIAVLGLTAAAAWAVGAPVGAHLDAQALGLGAFLACGRLGCLCAGCCHGRPAGWGVTYGARVAPHLRGVPLLPVQAAEAAGVAVLVAAGIVLPVAPGGAFAWYVSGYAVLRFGVELLRGDDCRPYRLGLSAAQWTSLAAAGVIAGLALAGVLPGAPLHAGVLAALVVAAPLAAHAAPAGLLDPRHIRELGRLLPRADGAVRETSLGVCCSAAVSGGVAHYTLSRRGRPLSAGEAGTLARHVLAARHGGCPGELVAGRGATFHVVVAEPAPAEGYFARRPSRVSTTFRTVARGQPRFSTRLGRTWFTRT